MKILTIPLTDTYHVLLLEAHSVNAEYSVSTKYGWVLNGKDSMETEVKDRYFNHLILKIPNITEEKAQQIFSEAGHHFPYTNYSDRAKHFDTALESLNSFLAENWDGDLKKTWILIPKPNKQLKGKKIVMEFDVGAADFGLGKGVMDLDVYMTPITKTSKSLTFSVRIPDFIYNKCMTDADIDQRPKRNYIEASTISTLHDEIRRYVTQAHNLEDREQQAKKATRVICIDFQSSEQLTRDDWNHAYTGQLISSRFKFFVAYKTHNGDYFSYKKYQSRMGTTEKGIKGIIDSELSGKRNYISKNPQVVITWTQEREDFLMQLEEKFRSLSENLNKFLADLDEDKLQKLIENSRLLKLGNG